MIRESEFPILNFDDDRSAKISVQQFEGRKALGIKHGVVCFDADARERLARAYPSEVVGTLKGCGIAPLNIYAVDFNGAKIVLHQGIAGGPWAASIMEELVAFGAVAQFYGVKFGQILYGGDSLCGDVWDKRDWDGDDVRRQAQTELLTLAMEMVTRI